MQDPEIVPRCDTEGRTEPQGQEGGSSHGNRDEGGDGNEDEYGNQHGVRGGGESGSGSRDENRDEDGGERDSGDLRKGNRGRSEDTIRHATPTSNQQLQPQDPTPQRDRRIMRRTRVQEQEARDRTREGGGEAKMSTKPQKSDRRDVENEVCVYICVCVLAWPRNSFLSSLSFYVTRVNPPKFGQ